MNGGTTATGDGGRADGRVRLVDLARRAGVTPSVVSAVLGGRAGNGPGTGTVRVGAETATRIRALAARLGYRPDAAAQALKGRASTVIGVLIGAESTPANYERLAAVERLADEHSHRLMIGQFHGDPARTADYLRDFRARGIAALLCFHNPAPRCDAPLRKLFREFLAPGAPAAGTARGLVFQTYSPVRGAHVVDVDRAEGVRQAVAHLLARGRRRLALVLNAPPAADPLMADRWRGFTAGLAAAGLEPDPRRVWHGDGTFPPAPEQAAAAVQAVVDAGGTDAIIASNDIWAMALLRILRRRGIAVPDMVAVVGMDNLYAAALFDPALTTIGQNNTAFARAVLDLLLPPAGGAPVPPGQQITVPPELVLRETG
ncbi:MAG: LacI family DNA-binding transcriptional regulator [Lentisphaeria bacterium]